MFYKYINLPALPDELICQALAIGTNSALKSDQTRGVYSRHLVSSDILVWCQQNILPTLVNNFKIGIQVFSGVPEFPHTDGSRGVKALNFLISPGGTNVETVWLQEEGFPVNRQRGYVTKSDAKLQELDRVSFVKNTWQIVQTDVIHTVVNLTEPRISLSLGLEDNEYDNLISRLTL